MTKIHYDTLPTRLESLSGPPLDPDTERELIDIVQNSDDRDVAFEALWAAHSRAAHQAVRRGSYDPRASKSQRAEDMRDALGEAALAFYAAVANYDLGEMLPLAETAYPAMHEAVRNYAMTTQGVGITVKQLKRYMAVLRKFDGDFNSAAAAVALGGYDISSEEFLAIRQMVDGSREDIDEMLIHGEDIASQESEEIPDINLALSVLDDRERQIVKLAYGFTDEESEMLRYLGGFTPGERMFDWQIAETLGVSRRTVFRARNSARRKMRDALLSDNH